MFAPVAVASLMYAGFSTNEERWNSKAASNILIAVAWGASVGGMATPLGGGQSVVTYGLLNKYLGYNISSTGPCACCLFPYWWCSAWAS